MPCAGDETARLVGVRIVLSKGKRSKWAVAYIHAVSIDIVLGSGACILKIIFPVKLVHPCSFNVRFLTEHPFYQRLVSIREICVCHMLRLKEPLITGINFFFCPRQERMVFPASFVSDRESVTGDQGPFFPDLMHRFRIQLHSPYWRHVGTSPVKIQSAVVIKEHMGIPEIKCPLYFLVRSVQDIFRPVKVTDLSTF